MTVPIIDQAPCGIFSFKDDGSLLSANDTICSLLNLDKESLIGRSVESMFTIPTRIFFQTHFFPLVKMHGHAEEIFISLLTSAGDYLPVLLNAKRIGHEDQTITICACIVVPNRKKFEDELVDARNKALTALKENTALIEARTALQQHAEKLEQQMRLVTHQNQELTQFNHVVSHNLKESLRKILIYTGKMQGETSSPTLDRLLKATEQMTTMVNGLQQYVWLNEKSNQFMRVDLNKVLQEAVKQLNEEADPGDYRITIEDLPHIDGDAGQLQLMFYHLLSNAVKFRGDKKASISIQSTILPQNKFRQVADRYQYIDFLRLEFRDEGIGFDINFQDRIYELFRKMHNNEGLGLGLALCKKVVDNHQGSIEAESKVNEFTKMTVLLPLEQEIQ